MLPIFFFQICLPKQLFSSLNPSFFFIFYNNIWFQKSFKYFWFNLCQLFSISFFPFSFNVCFIFLISKSVSLLEDIIGQYNSVFWIGDFNFRIDGDACPVENMLGDQNPNFEKILRSDQLLQLINEGKFHDRFHFILKFDILNLLIT